MALTRVSDKRLAANRANAQKSTGPRTPEGKARSSRNACVHHAFAHTHVMPEAWSAELHQQAHSLTALTADPIRRALETDLVFYALWHNRLLAREDRLLALCLDHFSPDPKLGAHFFVFDPGLRAFRRHLGRVGRHIGSALRALCTYLQPPIPRRPRVAGTAVEPPSSLEAIFACLREIRRTNPDLQQNTSPSVRPPAQQDSRPGLQHHPPVQTQAPAVDIVQIQPHPLVEIQPVPPGQRPQTCQTRPRSQAMGPRHGNALPARRKHSRVLRHRRAFADRFVANPGSSALGNHHGREPNAAMPP